MSAHPSVCKYQLSYNWMDFHKLFFILKTFIKLYQGNSKFFLYGIIKINRQQFNKERKFPIATLQSKYKA